MCIRDRCFNCQGLGHFAANCPHPKREKKTPPESANHLHDAHPKKKAQGKAKAKKTQGGWGSGSDSAAPINEHVLNLREEVKHQHALVERVCNTVELADFIDGCSGKSAQAYEPCYNLRKTVKLNKAQNKRNRPGNKEDTLCQVIDKIALLHPSYVQVKDLKDLDHEF